MCRFGAHHQPLSAVPLPTLKATCSRPMSPSRTSYICRSLRLAVSGESLDAAQRMAPESAGSARCMHVRALTIRADLGPRPAARPAPPLPWRPEPAISGARYLHEVFLVTGRGESLG